MTAYVWAFSPYVERYKRMWGGGGGGGGGGAGGSDNETSGMQGETEGDTEWKYPLRIRGFIGVLCSQYRKS